MKNSVLFFPTTHFYNFIIQQEKDSSTPNINAEAKSVTPRDGAVEEYLNIFAHFPPVWASSSELFDSDDSDLINIDLQKLEDASIALVFPDGDLREMGLILISCILFLLVKFKKEITFINKQVCQQSQVSII